MMKRVVVTETFFVEIADEVLSIGPGIFKRREYDDDTSNWFTMNCYVPLQPDVSTRLEEFYTSLNN